jgi:polyisoprenoid-binding protein YceI
MMKLVVFVSLLFVTLTAGAQGKYYTKGGKIKFFSSTSMENIDATNKATVCILDSKTGDLQFAVLMKSFEFKKALMQEHFNKNYAESDKFPKAEFKGQITNNSEIKYTTDGSYTAKIKGKLTIHGVTKDVETTGTIVIKDGKLTAASSLNIKLPDYNIKVSKLHRSQISDTIKITVDCGLEPLKS